MHPPLPGKTRLARSLGVRLLLIAALLALVASFVVGAILAEGAIHPKRIHDPSETAERARRISSSAKKVTIMATDGVRLTAWWLRSGETSGPGVIVCHGVGDSAYGALGFTSFLLKNGYSVLVPDSRGHGESLGFVTYGVLESSDIAKWVEWMRSGGFRDIYGLGESLGGAILIQSLAKGAKFNSIVAESAYSSFESVADERIGRWLPAPLAWLLVKEGILYVYLRYGVNLGDARPDVAIANAHVPILLIHGQLDNDTNSDNSIRLAHANPSLTTLWLVPKAKHTGAYGADAIGFEKKVLAEFGRPR